MSMIVSSFRRSVYAEPPRRGGGGGPKGNWRDNLKLQADATPIILIEGQYADPAPTDQEVQAAGIGPDGRPNQVVKGYFRTRKHKCKTTRNGRPYFPDEVCSAGWDKYNPQPCAGCMASDAGDKRLTLSDVYAFGIVHLVPYHLHPLWDNRNRQWVMKKDNSGPFMTETACTGRTCNFCRALSGHPPVVQNGEFWPGYDPRSISTKFGGRRYLELGKGHLGNLMSWGDTVSSKCANLDPATGRLCRTKLNPVGFDCPDCASVIIDLKTDTRTDQQILEAVSSPYPCMTCRSPKWLKAAFLCDRCDARDLDPTQFPVYGTVLHGSRRGDGKNSALVLDEFESVEEFEARVGAQYAPILHGKTIRQIVDELSRPYDFTDLYAPRPLEEQRKRLDITATGPAPQGYQPAPGGYQPPPAYPPQGYGQPQGYPQNQGYAQQQGQNPQPPPPAVPGRPNYS